MVMTLQNIHELVSFLTQSESIAMPIANRREQLVKQLAGWVGGDSGYWSWGRGIPLESTITPVATIATGFSKEQWLRFPEVALSDQIVRLFNQPIRELLKERDHVTVSRSLIWNDAEWSSDHYVQNVVHSLDWDNWLISVRYLTSDTWASMTLFRSLGKPDFEPADLELVELVMSSVEWMKPRVSESVCPSTFVDLSPRLRSVMLLLLDGQSRKQIASSLSITLHTVNDHCKEIYHRFEVNSATELAARFLKSA